MRVEVVIELLHYFGFRSATGAMIFEERYRPRPRQGDRNRPVPHWTSGNSRAPWLAANGIAVVEKVQPVQQCHDPFVGVETRRREARRLSKVADEVPVRLFDIGLQSPIWELVESPAPDYVVHATVKAELMAFGLK